MKLLMINGRNHQGSIYMVARKLTETAGGEMTEFFLPKDFDQPCIVCRTCFPAEMLHCPHYEKLRPITEAMDRADLMILSSPVYVFHTTGRIMSFLDHYATRWMVHRPNERMSARRTSAFPPQQAEGGRVPIRIGATVWCFGECLPCSGWASAYRQSSPPIFRPGFRKKSIVRRIVWQIRSKKTQANPA